MVKPQVHCNIYIYSSSEQAEKIIEKYYNDPKIKVLDVKFNTDNEAFTVMLIYVETGQLLLD